MLDHLRLVPITVLQSMVLILIAQPSLCANKSSSSEALPISLPASEFWYVASTVVDFG